jgi:uncharacterized protein
MHDRGKRRRGGGPDGVAVGGMVNKPGYSSELEHTFEVVLESGGEIVEQIFEFPGGRRFHFADPNGNELAVWSEG